MTTHCVSSTVRSSAWRLGIDVGSVAVKVVLIGPSGVQQSASRPHRGRPLQTVGDLVQELWPASTRSLCVGLTGGLRECVPAQAGGARINEVLATAAGARHRCPQARTVVDLGGQMSKWILLGDSAEELVRDVATNGLCAAGCGAFVEQQAGRLGLRVEQLAELAANASKAATIAGRCSVFAKSDMIHLQQKGTPADQIALGLCQAMVRSFLSTVARRDRFETPVVLAGGGANNQGLVRALGEAAHLGEHELVVPDDAELLGALGAAQLCAGSEAVQREAFLQALHAPSCDAGHEKRCLEPLQATQLESSAEVPEDIGPVTEAFLGIDVGSVSTNVAVLTPDLKLAMGVYLPTRGQPAQVLLEAMSMVRSRLGDAVRVVGVGTTGSGRHLAAALLGADVVHNEITAQMTAASQYVPEADTIFEIGGQDSKFIAIADGHLADFEMNKICSAGTGSFLEEQAQRLGVSIIGEFSERAMASRCPLDLGTRCTVFMDTEVVRAQQAGASIDDLCAGLAYSVARNYLDKVVGSRPIGKCIVFQGGTASNAAVVAAFARLLNRPIHVHPYNRISGAMGAALLAAKARAADASRPSAFAGWQLPDCPSASTFECKACENRCQISRMTMRGRTVHFGDACERYAEKDRARSRPESGFEDLFELREELLHEHLRPACEAGAEAVRVGLLRASLNWELLPFWATMLRALGFEPVVAPRTSAKLLSDHAVGLPAEVCLPIQAAAAQARALLDDKLCDLVFVPSVLEPSVAGGQACLYAQQLGDMLRGAVGSRVLAAQVALEDGWPAAVDTALQVSRLLNRSVGDVLAALGVAREAQRRFRAACMEAGRRALQKPFDRAVVVLGKPYNTHDSYLNLSLARHLHRLGLVAIPFDMLPIDAEPLSPAWSKLPWHYNRQQVRAMQAMQSDERLYPVWVSSYGCGPDGFTAKHLERMLAGRPRLLLEFDAHRGEAGLITRLEAFRDELDAHQTQTRTAQRFRYEPRRGTQPSRRMLLPRFSPHAHVYASVWRAAGFDVRLTAHAQPASIALGEAHSSGRECHPYSILLGDFLSLVKSGQARPGDALMLPSCQLPCLIQQYGDGIQLALDRAAGPGFEVFSPSPAEMGPYVGARGLIRLYEGLLAIDMLMALSTRLRAYERHKGAIDGWLQWSIGAVGDAIEQGTSVAEALERGASAMWYEPRDGCPGDKPLVGLTGDLYTRNSDRGNANVVEHLESSGCEVWLSPYFAPLSDLSTRDQGRRALRQGGLRSAANLGLTLAVTSRLRTRLMQALPAPVRELVREPDVPELTGLAAPYVGARSNPLLLDGVGKLAFFLEQGASGVVSAVGVNCMIGNCMQAAMPAIRDHYNGAPLVTLSYGGSDNPSQRLRLETFVHQVTQRAQARRLRSKLTG